MSKMFLQHFWDFAHMLLGDDEVHALYERILLGDSAFFIRVELKWHRFEKDWFCFRPFLCENGCF